MIFILPQSQQNITKRLAYRVGALVLQICFGKHDDRALLHEGLKLVHALVEAAAADLPSLCVQELKGEQLACRRSHMISQVVAALLIANMAPGR